MATLSMTGEEEEQVGREDGHAAGRQSSARQRAQRVQSASAATARRSRPGTGRSRQRSARPRTAASTASAHNTIPSIEEGDEADHAGAGMVTGTETDNNSSQAHTREDVSSSSRPATRQHEAAGEQQEKQEEEADVDLADVDIDALINSAEAIELDDLEEVLGSSTEALNDFTSLNLADAAFSEALATEDPARATEYIEDMQTETEEQHISIGMLDLEQIAAEEERLHAEIEKYEQFREEKLTRKQKMLLEQVIHVKKELSQLVETQKKKLRDAEKLYRRRRRRDMEALNRAFRRAEDRLLLALRRRRGEIKATYGDLTLTEGVYSGHRRRRWRIDWGQAPQPVQMKLACLRGLRDKCPTGRLVLSVSMYDRLGGHLMRWSRLPGQEWCGTTLPFKHDSRFFSVETDVNQSVFTVCPPEAAVKPSMVFVFEFFILKKDGMPFDRALAWGVFPMLNSDFEIVNGKFKLPMHRGDMDPSLITHTALERHILCDLDSWLCNLYLEVSRLPRYTSGQREYEVELQYTSSLLGHPERERPKDESPEDEMAKAIKHIRTGSDDMPQTAPPQGINALLREATAIPSHAHTDTDLEDLQEKTEDEDVTMYVKRSGPFEHYHRNVLRLTAARRQSKEKTTKPLSHLEELQQHSNSVAVLDCPHRKSVNSRVENKTAYVLRELASEYSISRIKTSTFWITIGCLLLCFWARLYLHYAGQWVFLQALRIPVTDFTARSFTVNLSYQPSLLLAREQLGVVALGPIAVMIFMILFIGISGLSRVVFGRFPEIGYRFILAWCFMTILDPVLILIVDLALQRWHYDGVEPVGDAFKLYWHFENSDDGGLPGVFITAFIYIVIMFSCAVVAYVYLLRLHLNSSILDLYRRLTAGPEETFVPYDNELSIFELEYVVRKAEQWRGQRGERRKVAVYDHVWSPDESRAAAEVVAGKGNGLSGGGRKARRTSGSGRRMSAEEVVLAMQRQTGDEVTTHVAIHTINLDGSSDIYRQFLRLPDGAIVEVFGTVSGSIDHRVQKTLDEANVDIATLTRESTRIIQDKFQSSALPVAAMRQRPSAFSLLSVSAFAMSQRRRTGSGTTSVQPRIHIDDHDQDSTAARRSTGGGSDIKDE